MASGLETSVAKKPWSPSRNMAAQPPSTKGARMPATDTETALRQRYGVTVQHTFVQVDPKGDQLAKWSGSSTGADIAGRLRRLSESYGRGAPTLRRREP